MASVKMWWIETNRTWKTGSLPITFDNMGFTIKYGATLYGPGNSWTGTHGTRKYHIRSVSLYGLAPERMPEDGAVFHSKPMIEYLGSLTGVHQDAGILPGNDPHVKCSITASHEMFTGDQHFNEYASKGHGKLETKGNADTDKLPLTGEKGAGGIRICLDRGRHLYSRVTVEFSINLRGNGELDFYGPGSWFKNWDFKVGIPQWHIVSEF